VISLRLGKIPPLGQVPLRTPRLVLIVGDVVEQHESCAHGVLEVDAAGLPRSGASILRLRRSDRSGYLT